MELAVELHYAFETRLQHINSRMMNNPFITPARRSIDSSELFHNIRLSRGYVRTITDELAKASLEDPNNVDVLQNLGILFDFLGDSQRKKIADSLAKEILSKHRF